MKKWLALLLLLLVSVTPAIGGEEFEIDEEPIDILLTMDEYRFIPEELVFESGKLYRLTIYNAGEIKHELDAPNLSSHIFTRKIVIFDDSGKMIAEIKGKPSEVEVAPGKSVEWWFVPFVERREEGAMICDIPGHRALGMTGSITIK